MTVQQKMRMRDPDFQMPTNPGNQRSITPATHRQESGAILITSLLILLVMTMLSLSAVTNSTLEGRMANNIRQGKIAQQAAETALQAARNWLETPGNLDDLADLAANFDGTNVTGHYAPLPTRPGASLVPVTFDITNDSAWTNANSQRVIPPDAGIPNTHFPRYIIEYVGRTEMTAGGPERGLQPLDPTGTDPDMREYAFEVTAIGWGYETSSRHLLRSSYRKRLGF
jgi:type IV pilus assembly protein PilX